MLEAFNTLFKCLLKAFNKLLLLYILDVKIGFYTKYPPQSWILKSVDLGELTRAASSFKTSFCFEYVLVAKLLPSPRRQTL